MSPLPSASRGLLLACLLASGHLSAAAATPLAAPPRPDPLDPQAPTRPLPHRSVWRGATPMPEVDPVDWRAAHEAVRQAGGWRALSRDKPADQPREAGR